MKISSEFKQMVAELGELAQVLCRVGTAQDEERFGKLLALLLSQTPAVESAIVGLVVSGLGQIGDTQALDWLLNELEIESELKYLPIPASGYERACLLFALPVVVSAGEQMSRIVQDEEAFELMHDVLSEASVIDSSAIFRLVPRLFTHQELFAKSYGQIEDLTLALAEKLLADEALEVPEDFRGLDPDPGVSPSPYCELYYVVGILATRDSDLEDVFPPIGELEEAQALGTPERDPDEERPNAFAMDEEGAMTSPIEVESAGYLDDGTTWEEAFAMAFDQAFNALFGLEAVMAPDGLQEDLRRGQELGREIGLMKSLDCVPDESAVYVRVGALTEPEDANSYIEVSWIDKATGNEVDVVQWTVLNHESEEQALDALRSALADTEVEQEDPRMAALTDVGCFLKH